MFKGNSGAACEIPAFMTGLNGVSREGTLETVWNSWRIREQPGGYVLIMGQKVSGGLPLFGCLRLASPYM